MCRYAQRKELFEAKQRQAEQKKEIAEVKAEPNTPASMFINCGELYDKIRNSTPTTLLLIDCRRSDEFAGSRIIYQNLIHIPGESIKPG